ncbi:hypothetical protein SAMN05216378_4583 [Paenibacillus catalpae]|uniref:Uncharacterized protein n=1 Tax=Paenibacillus catalpae TaxID=1045775 RepID=A0A1I2EZQ8_9BACL|nr:hypothetical protein [Paenibacillus catalpae]SFE97926.1 hypothetical protein SAMN05216378_4583 [Paenibacillus catalpae]
MFMYRFEWNERLLIALPVLDVDWEQYSPAEQLVIVEQWELIRGTIPDRVMEFERIINRMQNELFEEENFEESCRLNAEIAEYASRINDLHIWYRTNQELDSRRHS